MTAAQAPDAGGVVVERDVVYAHAGGIDLHCDVYVPPASRAKHLALVHVHGGGGNRGSKDGARLARPLAALGYLCIAMQYRLSDQALWPAQLEDLGSCVAWTQAHAQRFEVNTDKVGLVGYSIGGQFSLIASGSATQAGQIAACVALYPSGLNDSGTRTVMGPGASDDSLRQLDPLASINKGFPPTVLLHGNADSVVQVESSFALYDALTAAGVAAELHVIEGVNHSFEGSEEFATPSAAFIDLFLDRHVVNPRSYRERRR